MPVDRLEWLISEELAALGRSGTRKGAETVIRAVVPPERGRGPRYRLEGEDDRPFLRMNSNGYLGLALRPEVQAAQEQAARAFGAGPAAVRFISGTFAPHVALERELAEFHGREAAMLFGSAYAAMMGVLPPLVTPETLVVSDELNHSCIINALRLARPAAKHVYPHLDVARVEQLLARGAGRFQRAIVVTDGVFSMRGDHAPLDRLVDLAGKYDASFPQNVLLVVDDSHGVGALGASGRGTEERTGSGPVDLLVATLGKALGVNGGYAAGSRIVIEYLRETSPFYVYSNPIGPAEAAAARRALALLRSDVGRALLEHLRAMTRRFADGLVRLGWETLPGEHPVVPLLVRDTARTAALVAHLRRHGVLATGLAYPVVPRGEEEIRFQLSADHTPADVDEALAALASFPDRS